MSSKSSGGKSDARPSNKKDIAVNKKALFKYNLVDKFECGIELTGTEVKSLRDRNVSFVDSYAQFRGNELYLMKLNIARYKAGSWTNHEPERPRRLLLHRSELNRLAGRVRQKGNTIVPIALYFKNGWAKVQIALVTHKTGADKRQTMKERDAKRDLDRARKWRR